MKKANIIETSIFSEMLGANLLKLEEPKDLGPINLAAKKKDMVTPVAPEKKIEYDFKQGDVIIPSNGIKHAFHFQRKMKLNPNYTYKKANSAEKIYWMKRIVDSKTSVAGYNDIMDIGNEKHDYDKSQEVSPYSRII